MEVNFVSTTSPSKDLQEKGVKTAEDLIVYCARVSNPKNQLNVGTGSKLLKYCVNHGHWSIFEQADMCLEIKTSRAISAQILRHKSFSPQEFSQRYQEVQVFEPIELRKQGETNRQVGDEVFDPDLVTDIVTDNFEYTNVEKASEAVERIVSDVSNLYNKLIEAGVARECARMILPMASQSTLYFKGSVRSWIHYLELRTKQDTQKEHREVAEACKKIFIDKFPIISEALGWK